MIVSLPKKALSAAAMALACLPWLASMQLSRSAEQAERSTEQWAAWRDEQIKTIFTPTYDAAGERILLRDDVIERSAEAYRFLVPVLGNPEFLKDPERAKALKQFVSFVKAQNWMAVEDSRGMRTHTLGMDITDRDYFRYAEPYVTFPELLRTQKFLGYMSDPASYKRGIDMIQAHNRTLPEERKWIVYPFRAQFILSADKTTYGRILVLVPNVPMPTGEILDQWILFAAVTPDMPQDTKIRSVSVVAILRNPATPGKHKAFLSDFLREQNEASGKIELNPNYFIEPNPSKNCYDCHKAGVIPLHPKVSYFFDSRGKLAVDPEGPGSLPAKVNGLIAAYGKSDFGHLNSDAYGPTMGSGKAETIDKALNDVVQEQPLSEESLERVRSAMQCGSCHNSFAKINYMIATRTDRDYKSFELKTNMIQTYIEQGIMPPGSTLTTEERAVLWKALSKSYFDPRSLSGTLIDWLKGEI